MRQCFTIGYGGRTPDELVQRLRDHGIVTVVDVRIRPDKAHLGAFVRAKSDEKGIARLFSAAGIHYLAMPELGNVFRGQDDWAERYCELMERAGDLLTQRLRALPSSSCLLCAEKRADDCHRLMIAEYLEKQGWSVQHIE